MSEQLDILAWTPPPQRYRTGDRDTSIESGEAIRPAVKELQQRVLDWLRTQPEGATDEQLLVAMKSTSSTYRTRRSELVAKGLVKDSGKRVVLSTGRKAIVWVVV